MTAILGEGERTAVVTGLLSFQRLRLALRSGLAAQAGRGALWSPVAMGIGAGAYLGLKTEPGWVEVLAPLVVALVVVVVIRRAGMNRAWAVAAVLIACAALGFAAGKARTASVAGPIAPATGAVQITGWVVDVANPGESGGRLIIAPASIGALSADRLPSRIRVTVKDALVGPGNAVRFTGLINAPPPPASPGAYDFARNAWFDRIGGVGVALTQPQIVTLKPPPWGLKVLMGVNATRWSLAQQIAADMSPTSRGLGVAMITGYEA